MIYRDEILNFSFMPAMTRGKLWEINPENISCLCKSNFFCPTFEEVMFQSAMHIIADDGGRKKLAFFTFYLATIILLLPPVSFTY
jgi:hypothetical protein